MCPFCLATAAIIAGSATGTGGLTALVAGKFLTRKAAKKFPATTEAKEKRYGHEPDGSASPENGLARAMD
jgi:hypothetical protein